MNLNVQKLSQCIKKDKNNYRPVSTLSNISKLYDKCKHQQINEYFESLLSKFQWGFTQRFSAQHYLLVMVKNNEKIRDNKEVFAVVLIDLSRAFECIPHGLLIAKLNAFGFNKKSLSFISFLHNREQKTKLGSEFSDFLNILFVVPRRSILGPILFIIFIADLFCINNDIDFASYVDDTTPYVCGQNFSEVSNFLESNITNVFK